MTALLHPAYHIQAHGHDVLRPTALDKVIGHGKVVVALGRLLVSLRQAQSCSHLLDAAPSILDRLLPRFHPAALVGSMQADAALVRTDIRALQDGRTGGGFAKGELGDDGRFFEDLGIGFWEGERQKGLRLW